MEHNMILVMIVIMIISSILSGMNSMVSNIGHIRIHLNDIYMGLLMSGWMYLLLGLYELNSKYIIIGILLIVVMMVIIRKQLFINDSQYLDSMIPHHSMAIFMSKKILEKVKDNKIVNDLATNIINNQEKEIDIMVKKY
jgi:hypothetical protein